MSISDIISEPIRAVRKSRVVTGWRAIRQGLTLSQRVFREGLSEAVIFEQNEVREGEVLSS